MADDLRKVYGTPATIGDLLTTTADNIQKGKVENVRFNEFPTLKWMETNCKDSVSGGVLIDVNLEYNSNGTVAFISPTGSIADAPTQILTQALYKPAFLAGKATISLDDMSANNGAEKLADLTKIREVNLTNTMRETIEKGFYNETPGIFDPNTFLEIMSTSNPAAARGNLGNINRDTYTWWQSNSSSVGSFSAVGPSVISAMQKTIAPSAGMDVPDAAFTTATIFGYLEANAQNRVRFSDKKMAEFGFDSIKVGSTAIFYSEFCPSGYMFLLNSKYLRMKVYSMVDMKRTPYIQADNSFNYQRLVAHKYQICAIDPDKLGVLTGITA